MFNSEPATFAYIDFWALPSPLSKPALTLLKTRKKSRGLLCFCIQEKVSELAPSKSFASILLETAELEATLNPDERAMKIMKSGKEIPREFQPDSRILSFKPFRNSLGYKVLPVDYDM